MNDTHDAGVPDAREQLAGLNFALLLVGPDLSIREANPAAESLSGQSARRLVRRRLLDVVQVDDERIGAKLVEDEAEFVARGVEGRIEGRPLVLTVGVSMLVNHPGWRMVTLAEGGPSEARAEDQSARGLRAPAVLAHEIKNPLASLKGNAQLLASTLDEGKPKQKAVRVVDEAVRLEKLVADLLAFVRTGELDRAPTPPARLVPDGVEVDAGAAPATWSLDEARMRQVISNLVENGQAAGGPVTVRIAAEDARLVIEVADHGPGVPAEDKERIFEPFFTKKTRGTGLGLAIARRIVESHGGTIVVRDGTSGGAVFRIEIPEA
ncbi:MAG: HAMP domain-containing histidine kinase [Deltaproteobacteria bacterium]|nr:HAMP domain-containing histidine kinase [Deltaproteobacteria bacterium]